MKEVRWHESQNFNSLILKFQGQLLVIYSTVYIRKLILNPCERLNDWVSEIFSQFQEKIKLSWRRANPWRLESASNERAASEAATVEGHRGLSSYYDRLFGRRYSRAKRSPF